MDKQKLEEMTLEETFSGVDDIMKQLSSEDISLEDSFTLYKEGMELIKHCSDVIEKVEKQIIILQGEEETESE